VLSELVIVTVTSSVGAISGANVNVFTHVEVLGQLYKRISCWEKRNPGIAET